MKAPETISSITDPLENLLGYELRRASVAAMAALSTELDPLGLRPSEASMLKIIGANPGCTQSEICRALRVQPANMVPLINRLMAAGSLERVRTEGRALAIFLTAQGQVLLGQVTEAITRHEERIARHLPDDMRDQVIAALRLICRDACCDDLP